MMFKRQSAMTIATATRSMPWLVPLALLGNVATSVTADAASIPVTVDARRSLFVTEQTILQRFPLKRVLDQLVAQSGVPQLTSLNLFHQWWDTQNPGPGLNLGPHCDDNKDVAGTSLFNEFPYTCRDGNTGSDGQEGLQAQSDPFTARATNPDAYIPIALANRFDLAPGDGSNCGEYRIIYAKRSGAGTDFSNLINRNLIIFEASMPNPAPAQGLKGCKKIQAFWAGLSAIDNINLRAGLLEVFYFHGLTGNIEPVVHINHYGNNPSGLGQVRTNQFMQDPTGKTKFVWSLREFKLERSCSGNSCTAMRFVPATDKTNPFGPLFQPNPTHPKANAFQNDFVNQIQALAATTVPGIDMKVADTYNTAQSNSSSSVENDYACQFNGGDPATCAQKQDSILRGNIEAKLAELGNTTLTADHVVRRAQALSCAGCHMLSGNNCIVTAAGPSCDPANPENPAADLGNGLKWPNSLGFVHVSEQLPETVDGLVRFRISPALQEVFLPQRKKVMEAYLNDVLKGKGPRNPIGGFRVH